MGLIKIGRWRMGLFWFRRCGWMGWMGGGKGHNYGKYFRVDWYVGVLRRLCLYVLMGASFVMFCCVVFIMFRSGFWLVFGGRFLVACYIIALGGRVRGVLDWMDGVLCTYLNVPIFELSLLVFGINTKLVEMRIAVVFSICTVLVLTCRWAINFNRRYHPVTDE